MEIKNCAFQFATIRGNVIFDKSELTLSEAKNFWNKYYPQCAQLIHNGTACQMYLWINMDSPDSYGETLYQIDNDAESNGFKIWETKTIEFPKTI